MDLTTPLGFLQGAGLFIEPDREEGPEHTRRLRRSMNLLSSLRHLFTFASTQPRIVPAHPHLHFIRDVQHYLSGLLEPDGRTRRLSDHSVMQHLSNLRAVYKQLYRQQLITDTEYVYVKEPASEPYHHYPDRPTLPPEQHAKLLSTATGAFKVALLLVQDLAFSPAELKALRWGQINPKGRTIVRPGRRTAVGAPAPASAVPPRTWKALMTLTSIPLAALPADQAVLPYRTDQELRSALRRGLKEARIAPADGSPPLTWGALRQAAIRRLLLNGSAHDILIADQLGLLHPRVLYTRYLSREAEALRRAPPDTAPTETGTTP